MLKFELRCGIFLYESPEEEMALRKSGLPNRHLRKQVTIPLNFIPNELDLKFDNLRQGFTVESTRWDEKAKKLIVFAKFQWWLLSSYEPHFKKIFAQGYRLQTEP